MDDQTREALRAYYRLYKATAAAVGDPTAPGAAEKLTAAAQEAHDAARAAGLLDLPREELAEMIRQQYPDAHL